MYQKPAPGKQWDENLVTAFWGTFLPGLVVGGLTVLIFSKLLKPAHDWAALPAMTGAIFTPAFVAATLRWRIPIFTKVLGANLVLGMCVSVMAEPGLTGLLPGFAYTTIPAVGMAGLCWLMLDKGSRYRAWVYAAFVLAYLIGTVWQFFQRHR